MLLFVETMHVCTAFLKSLVHKLGHKFLVRHRWEFFLPLLHMLAADEIMCCLLGLSVHELYSEESLLLPGGHEAASHAQGRVFLSRDC